ncbi:hypothetical protein BVY03_02750, partial [bacterium K02(2017)]
MKKLSILSLVFALALIASTAHAISLNTGSIKSVAKDVGKMVAMDNLNKDLGKVTGSCKCNTKTGKITGCNLSKAKSSIDKYKTGVKLALNKSFRIRTEVNRACWSHLQSKIPSGSGYWSWYNSKWVKTNNVSIRA